MTRRRSGTTAPTRVARAGERPARRARILELRLSELSRTGWALAIVALGTAVLVAIPLGRWALDAIDATTFRWWRDVLIYAMALPGFAAAVLTFVLGQRLLGALGIHVRRTEEPPAAERPPRS